LLDGKAVPRQLAAESLSSWLLDRVRGAPTTLVSDSGYDRWAIAELLRSEDLPQGIDWRCVPFPYEALNGVVQRLGLRRHHALDDARALGHVLLTLQP
jgi:hypothetical protein